MKPILSVALVAGLALTGCGGGSHASLSPVPAKSGAAKHVRHLKTDKRPSNILGGAPGITITISLTDAPLVGADASNSVFNAGIVGVDAIDTSGDSWQLIANNTPQVVNLLALQNSSMNMGNGNLPAGTYPSVQLLLDPATTTVTYNGATYPVQFTDPNHPWWDVTQTIEAVNVPLSVTGNDGDTIGATLDFNVFQSADLENGIVYLTPTVAAGIAAPTINGSVVNQAGSPVGNATVIATDSNGNVANVTVTGADGTFHLHGINPGGYTISVANTYTTQAGVTVTAQGADAGAAPSTYVVVGPNAQLQLNPLSD